MENFQSPPQANSQAEPNNLAPSTNQLPQANQPPFHRQDQAFQPTTSSAQSQPKSKKWLLFILMVIGLLAIGLGYANQQGYLRSLLKPQTSLTPQPVESPSPISTPTPTNQLNNEQTHLDTSSEWQVMTSSLCGVLYQLPPKAPPYFQPIDPNKEITFDNEGRFWNQTEYGDPNEIGEDWETFTAHSLITYGPEGGETHVTIGISIDCATNPQELTTNQLVSKLQQQAAKDSSAEISSLGKESMWGQQVEHIVAKSQAMGPASVDFYVFADTNGIYKIRKTDDPDYPYDIPNYVKQTRDQIFDSLKFPE